jgi:outer membrane protein TolC
MIFALGIIIALETGSNVKELTLHKSPRMRFFLAVLLLFVFALSFAQSRTLVEYISIAKENNSSLKTFQNQILANKLDSQILRAGFKTHVDFNSNNMYAPVIGGWGYDEAITNIAQVSAMVQASRSFLSKGNLESQYRAIALQSQALRDSLQLSIKDLVRAVTDQYIAAYGDQLTMDYSKELFDVLKKEEEVLKKLAQQSVIKQTEFLAFDITVEQQELTYLQAQIQYNADFLTLNYLAGIVDTVITRIAEPRLEDSLPRDIYTSVFYQRYVTDSLRIVNEKKIIDYSYRPSVTAFGDAGFNSSLQNTPYKNVGFSIGVNIRMPIYDAHQRQFKYQKLDLEENTRLSNKSFFVKQYTQQTAQLYRQLREINLLYDKIRQQVEYTRTLIIAYEKLLETSDVKIIDVVAAITSYMNAQNLLRQNLVSRLKILNQINYWNQ